MTSPSSATEWYIPNLGLWVIVIQVVSCERLTLVRNICDSFVHNALTFIIDAVVSHNFTCSLSCSSLACVMWSSPRFIAISLYLQRAHHHNLLTYSVLWYNTSVPAECHLFTSSSSTADYRLVLLCLFHLSSSFVLFIIVFNTKNIKRDQPFHLSSHRNHVWNGTSLTGCRAQRCRQLDR